MTYHETSDQMNAQRMQIAELRQKIRELQSAIEPQEVDDYGFETANGTVHLSELFDNQDTLFVIHNMGTGCSYCTLWADGLQRRCRAFAGPRRLRHVDAGRSRDTQAKFKASRGWTFPYGLRPGLRLH